MNSNAYRFGISRLPSTGPELRTATRNYESAGLDFVAIGDHVAGGVSPFATLAAAAVVSENLRLRTYVVNTGLWNAAFLAREAMTLDQLSQGRLELGLGAGNAKSEFDAVGAMWQGPEARVHRMRDMLLEVRRHLECAETSSETQRPVPVLVGAMSHAGLAVAAEHAEIIAFSGLRHRVGHPPGTLRAVTAEEADELIAAVRRNAGSRRYESDILLQAVKLGRDPLVAAKSWVEKDPDDMDPMTLAESPCVLFAQSAADAAAEVERRRQRWGFTSMTTFAQSSEALLAVMHELR
jgi:probable F420-dependent oxidoreductase